VRLQHLAMHNFQNVVTSSSTLRGSGFSEVLWVASAHAVPMTAEGHHMVQETICFFVILALALGFSRRCALSDQ